jgi:hypothetical protein
VLNPLDYKSSEVLISSMLNILNLKSGEKEL